MKMKMTIEFDPIEQSLSVVENDFTHIEAMGILQATIQTIGSFWIKNSDLELFDDE